MFLGSIYYGLLEWLVDARGHFYDLRGRAFDARHGVQTEGQVAVSDLDISETFKPNAVKYQPTKVTVFNHVMNQLPIKDFGDFAFIDYGCGKGRCLLLAAQFNFGKIIGIDLAKSLCAIAEGNARQFMQGSHQSRIDIQCRPSIEADLPKQPSVYYLYNPFNEQITAETLHAIGEHLAETNVEAYALYINPRYQTAFTANGFKLLDSGTRCAEEWTLWHRPATAQYNKTLSAAA